MNITPSSSTGQFEKLHGCIWQLGHSLPSAALEKQAKELCESHQTWKKINMMCNDLLKYLEYQTASTCTLLPLWTSGFGSSRPLTVEHFLTVFPFAVPNDPLVPTAVLGETSCAVCLIPSELPSWSPVIVPSVSPFHVHSPVSPCRKYKCLWALFKYGFHSYPGG